MHAARILHSENFTQLPLHFHSLSHSGARPTAHSGRLAADHNAQRQICLTQWIYHCVSPSGNIRIVTLSDARGTHFENFTQLPLRHTQCRPHCTQWKTNCRSPLTTAQESHSVDISLHITQWKYPHSYTAWCTQHAFPTVKISCICHCISTYYPTPLYHAHHIGLLSSFSEFQLIQTSKCMHCILHSVIFQVDHAQHCTQLPVLTLEKISFRFITHNTVRNSLWENLNWISESQRGRFAQVLSSCALWEYFTVVHNAYHCTQLPQRKSYQEWLGDYARESVSCSWDRYAIMAEASHWMASCASKRVPVNWRTWGLRL